MKALAYARSSLWIATASLKQTRIEDPGGTGGYVPLVELLARLARDGVEVRLLHAGDPSSPFMASLRESGALASPGFEMRRCRRVHFKTIIVDGEAAYMGSANVTGAGLGAKSDNRRNFEVGVWIEGGPDRERTVERLRSLFSAVWSGAFCGECGRRRDCEPPLAGQELP